MSTIKHHGIDVSTDDPAEIFEVLAKLGEGYDLPTVRLSFL